MRITIAFWKEKSKEVKVKEKHNCSQTKKWANYIICIFVSTRKKIIDPNLLHSKLPISVDFVSCFTHRCSYYALLLENENLILVSGRHIMKIFYLNALFVNF